MATLDTCTVLRDFRKRSVVAVSKKKSPFDISGLDVVIWHPRNVCAKFGIDRGNGSRDKGRQKCDVMDRQTDRQTDWLTFSGGFLVTYDWRCIFSFRQTKQTFNLLQFQNDITVTTALEQTGPVHLQCTGSDLALHVDRFFHTKSFHEGQN